jgi:hypothetical protein
MGQQPLGIDAVYASLPRLQQGVFDSQHLVLSCAGSGLAGLKLA